MNMAQELAHSRGTVDRPADDSAAAEHLDVEQVKHTIQLPLGLWSKLEQRARRWGVTKAEALRRAVWLFTYVADCMDDGATIMVERPDGQHERLVISPY
jgi:hypothetical protein